MVQKLRPFFKSGGFGLLVEVHWEGTAPAACAAGLFLTLLSHCRITLYLQQIPYLQSCNNCTREKVFAMHCNSWNYRLLLCNTPNYAPLQMLHCTALHPNQIHYFFINDNRCFKVKSLIMCFSLAVKFLVHKI